MNPKDKPLAWLYGEVKTPPFSKEARLEAGDPAVSIDLLVKSLFILGVSKKELGRSIS